LAIRNQKLTARLTAIQKDYWRFDAKEKASLVRRGPDFTLVSLLGTMNEHK
jgi:hypothetical protein